MLGVQECQELNGQAASSEKHFRIAELDAADPGPDNLLRSSIGCALLCGLLQRVGAGAGPGLASPTPVDKQDSTERKLVVLAERLQLVCQFMVS